MGFKPRWRTMAHGRGDDGFVGADDRGRRSYGDIARVVVMERLDIAIFPDFLGDADDAVGKILRPQVEAFEGCFLQP